MPWGFFDWVRGRRPPKPAPPELPNNPTADQLRPVILRLLDSDQAYDSSKLLKPHKDRARPILESCLRDDTRFQDMKTQLRGWSRPIHDVILTILFEWHSEFAIEYAIQLASSPDPALRAIAARLLASTGQVRFADVLIQLTSDSDQEVRDAASVGISRVLEYGSQYGCSFEDALGCALFDFMRNCALRTDKGHGRGFATALFRADRQRAIAEFDPDQVLNIDRLLLDDLLVTLHKNGVKISKERIELLLDQSIAALDSPTYSRRDSFIDQYLVTELLCLLANFDAPQANVLIKRLQHHPQEEARDAAIAARERLSPDHITAVFDRLKRVGSPDKLPNEFQVVYYVQIVMGEVANGGWPQWVANTGDSAHPTLAALKQINATEPAHQLQQVLDILGPDAVSKNQAIRMAAIDGMMNKNLSLPDDAIMWSLQTQTRAQLQDYIEQHPQAFK